MDATKSKIYIKNLEKTFHSDGRSLTALRDLSLEIEDEEFFGIVGPSGCGKTTLLNLIEGIEQPTEGSILINGSEVTGPCEQEISVPLNRLPWYTRMA